jgi:methylthioribose-1-phosphate isomerase
VRIFGRHYRTLSVGPDRSVDVLDQTLLPHRLEIVRLTSLEDAAHAIRAMVVRGAPLIGATAAYGVALAMREDASDAALARASDVLLATRPTAVNLRFAVARMRARLATEAPSAREDIAYAEASALCEEDVSQCARIGEAGAALIETHARSGAPVQVLTHCNAGWLACVDHGTALSAVYAAHARGIPLHVWVDETRPRGQGALLTAFELGQEGIPHTVIADNAGGHYMQRRMVDLCIVGADRVARNGDAANKIGTYLKALAAFDNGVPFHVAVPSTSVDFTLDDGAQIPIEERGEAEVTHVTGLTAHGALETVRVVAEGSPARNPGFDVTPARLVTSIITERGVCPATREGIRLLFPEASR